MLAASIETCSRGKDVALLWWTNSSKPCGRWPPCVEAVGERGRIVWATGSIFSVDISNWRRGAVAAMFSAGYESLSQSSPDGEVPRRLFGVGSLRWRQAVRRPKHGFDVVHRCLFSQMSPRLHSRVWGWGRGWPAMNLRQLVPTPDQHHGLCSDLKCYSWTRLEEAGACALKQSETASLLEAFCLSNDPKSCFVASAAARRICYSTPNSFSALWSLRLRSCQEWFVSLSKE